MGHRDSPHCSSALQAEHRRVARLPGHVRVARDHLPAWTTVQGVAPSRYLLYIQNSPSPLCLDHIFLRRFWGEKLAGARLGEPSATVRERVSTARTVQAKRFKGTRLLTNAAM